MLLLPFNCCRHMHRIVSLVLLQRTEVIGGFMLTNFETLEVGEEHQLAKHEWALQQLGITPDQVLAIGRATEFFERLMQPIMQERQQLQREIAQQQEAQLEVCSSNSSSGNSDELKQIMAKREVMLIRLSSLLRKEYLVRIAACCVVIGPLTYVQLAKLIVQMTPHPASIQVLGKLLQQQYQQQQQQQAQQKPAPPAQQQKQKKLKARKG
jgi:hypothetical protein